MSEVEKMTKVRKKNKTPTNLVGSKSRPTATMLACAPGAFNLSGFGQLYNGEYIKALGFFVTQFTAAYLYVQSDSPGYGAIMLGTYGFSIYDANVSAKKINEKRLQQHEQSNASTLLQYVPNEGLMVSLSSGF
ncbi:hypothetical protein CMK18_08065 [Candidatus Poribacteria bacterium]|nr:hypothetical protein [Candidatus Poribacteria bacterium]